MTLPNLPLSSIPLHPIRELSSFPRENDRKVGFASPSYETLYRGTTILLLPTFRQLISPSFSLSLSLSTFSIKFRSR